MVEVAAGLGSYIVGGGMSLRFSPKHPRKVLQTSSLSLALRDTQSVMHVLDSSVGNEKFSINDEWNISRVPIQQEAEKGNLRYIVSSYDAANSRIVDNDVHPGRKVVTFANVLKHKAFPLAEIANFMLTTGEKHMGRAVEVEFAGNISIDENNMTKGEVLWLQIRPMIDRSEMVDTGMFSASPERLLMACRRALGHGTGSVKHMVWIKPESFNFVNNPKIATEIAKINCNFTDCHENYILAGVGRWGSSDNALGIPVKWADISRASLVVEISMPGHRIEPSQGTHFFQNLTSMGVGYFTIGEPGDGSFIDEEYIRSCPAAMETDNLKVITFQSPMTIAINGMEGSGVVLKSDDPAAQDS